MKAFSYVFIELDKYGDDKYDQSNIDNTDEHEWLELMKVQDTNCRYNNKQVNSPVEYVRYVSINRREEYINAKMEEDRQENLFYR